MYTKLSIFLTFFVVVHSSVLWPAVVKMNKKNWILNKIYDGIVTSVASDGLGKVYFVEDTLAFVFNETENVHNPEVKSVLGDLNAFDVTSDRNGNVYFGSKDAIYRVEPNNPVIIQYHSEKYLDFNLVTCDLANRLYFASSNESTVRVDRHFWLRNLDSVDGALAVSSRRLYYFRNLEGRAVFYDRVGEEYIKGLEDEFLLSSAVDKDDNVYFATLNGLFLKAHDSEVAKKVDDFGVPDMAKIAIDSHENLYIASMDANEGGIYVLKD